jgi:S-adenosylmethionine decarboxylase
VSAVSPPIGTHLFADFFGVEAEILRDGPRLEAALRSAAWVAGSHVLTSHFHSFGGRDGVTGVVLLAESHISIHTWPEYGFAALDIFMCGNSDPGRALAELIATFAPARKTVRTEARGNAVTRVLMPDTPDIAVGN